MAPSPLMLAHRRPELVGSGSLISPLLVVCLNVSVRILYLNLYRFLTFTFTISLTEELDKIWNHSYDRTECNQIYSCSINHQKKECPTSNTL